MKSLEELALAPEQVQAITEKAIAATIEEVARGKRIFAQFFKENRDLVGEGKPFSIAFPKKGTGISASWDVSPNSTIPSSSFGYDAVTITVKKGGIRLEFTNEAILQANRDVIRDHITEAGEVWADTIDEVAYNAMLNIQRATLTISGGSVGAGSYPITEIISVTGGTILKVNYGTGTITLTGSVSAATVVYEWAKRPFDQGLFSNVATPQSLSAKDILLAKAALVAKNRQPDFVIINDADLPNLLYDPAVKFLEGGAYREREPLLRGEIGQIFGLRVITSTNAPRGAAIVVDKGALGYHVIKSGLKATREDKPERDAVWYHLWSMENFGVVNDDAVFLLVNANDSSTAPAGT